MSASPAVPMGTSKGALMPCSPDRSAGKLISSLAIELNVSRRYTYYDTSLGATACWRLAGGAGWLEDGPGWLEGGAGWLGGGVGGILNGRRG
jgi:hypothetical protein